MLSVKPLSAIAAGVSVFCLLQAAQAQQQQAQPNPQPQVAPAVIPASPPATTPVTAPSSDPSPDPSASASPSPTPSPVTLEEKLKAGYYMHSTTFPVGANSDIWGRDGTEFEGLRNLTCKARANDTEDQLMQFHRDFYGALAENDFKEFKKVSKCKVCEAFTTQYPVDEIPWDAASHKIREAFPHLWFTIEDKRFEAEEAGDARSLSFGADLMDDLYYDTPDFTLFDHDYVTRARKRWDSYKPIDLAGIRRILIAVKYSPPVDANGIKAAKKTDIRMDVPKMEALATLSHQMPTGYIDWEKQWNGGKTTLVKPLQGLYADLASKGFLPDVAGFKQVLQLEPMAFLRSLRARYHLNETSMRQVFAYYQLGGQRLKQVAERAKFRISDPSAGLMEKTALSNLVAKIESALSTGPDSLIRKYAGFGPEVTLEALLPMNEDANEDVTSEASTLFRRSQTMDAVTKAYHELGAEIAALRPTLIGTDTGTPDKKSAPEWFRAWVVSTDKAQSAKYTTFEPFAKRLDDILKDTVAGRDARAAELTKFGTEQQAAGNADFAKFVPITSADLSPLRNAVLDRQLDIWTRQIEAAGSAAKAIYFADYTRANVNGRRKQTYNFIIDTTDAAAMFNTDDVEVKAAARSADGKLAGVKTDDDGKVLPGNIACDPSKAAGNQFDPSAPKPKADPNCQLVTEKKTISPMQITNEHVLTSGTISKRLLNLAFVNEAQIELESEQPFTEAIATREAAGQDSAQQKNILGEYRKFLIYLTEIKKDQVLGYLNSKKKFSSLCKEWDWGNAELAKGEQGIKKVKKERQAAAAAKP